MPGSENIASPLSLKQTTDPAGSRFAKWDETAPSNLADYEAEFFKLQLKNAEYEANLKRALVHLQSLKARNEKMIAAVAKLNAESEFLRRRLNQQPVNEPAGRPGIRESAGLHISL